MLIELHLLQNHSPSNPNRDDLGAPKTAMFGGRLRARISSQCLKRVIRRSANFQDELRGHLGMRTKLFPHLVSERLKTSLIPLEEHARVVAACQRIGKKEGGTEEKTAKTDLRPKTPQLIFLGPNDVDVFVQRLERVRLAMPDNYAFYLNPVASFKELVKARLEQSEIQDEKIQNAIVVAAWCIATLRIRDLFADDEPAEENLDGTLSGNEDAAPAAITPDEEGATRLVERLIALHFSAPARFKVLIKKPSKVESSKLDDSSMERPDGQRKFEIDLLESLKHRAVDIAFFGRMTTSDAFEDTEAAIEVADAISANEVKLEVDYFTAVDDDPMAAKSGAAHVGTSQFNSSLYYKYFSIDWQALCRQLEGEKPTDEQKQTAQLLAATAVRVFIQSAVWFVPTGKKKGHAHNDQPAAVLVEVKKKRVPTNYANAFVKPATASADRDLVEDSIAKFGQYVGAVADGYGIEADRFWYALRGEQLEYRKPFLSDARVEAVGHTERVGSIEGIISQTLKKLGLSAETMNTLSTAARTEIVEATT